jgi:hypothetical protein
MAYILASQVKEFILHKLNPRLFSESPDNIVRVLVNHTHKQVYKVNKTDTVFEAIEAAFKTHPEWSKTDDIRFNACCVNENCEGGC